MAFRCGQKHIDDKNISINIIRKAKIAKFIGKARWSEKNASRERENVNQLSYHCRKFDIRADQKSAQ